MANHRQPSPYCLGHDGVPYREPAEPFHSVGNLTLGQSLPTLHQPARTKERKAQSAPLSLALTGVAAVILMT